MASHQISKDKNVSCDIKAHTTGTARNSSRQTISLVDKMIWEGSQVVVFPETINDQGEAIFTTTLVSKEGINLGSIAGLAFEMDIGIKWIVAWSNTQAEDSKVYTDICHTCINWGQIKKDLDTKGQQKYSTTKFPYTATIEIEPQSLLPTIVKAKIELGGCVQGEKK